MRKALKMNVSKMKMLGAMLGLCLAAIGIWHAPSAQGCSRIFLNLDPDDRRPHDGFVCGRQASARLTKEVKPCLTSKS
jgi:hypothetical protein